MSIEVLDADNMARLPRPDGSPDAARCYIASVVRRGPRAYVDNANVRMDALVIDEKVLPLVISERVEGNSNVCSAYAHYFEYPFQELARRYRRVPFGLLRAARSLPGALLRSGSIDRLVFVNNWLLTTNPRPWAFGCADRGADRLPDATVSRLGYRVPLDQPAGRPAGPRCLADQQLPARPEP